MATPARAITPRVVVAMLLVVVVVPLLPLLITRQWAWWQAWVYAGVSIGGFVVSRVLAARRHPDLLAERARMLAHTDTAPFDKWLAPLVGLGGGLIPLAAGLNALLAPRPTYSGLWLAAAVALLLAGYALGSYALLANRYFSGVVRLQTDRGQQVVSSGPYAWVRHPGYAGALLAYAAVPILLEAPWAWLPVGVMAAALVLRTALEDRLLQAQLAGYRAYAQRVRYRLLPGVW